MNKDNKNIENKIAKEAEKSTPEVWSEVEKDIKNGKGEVITLPAKKRKHKILSFVSTIAAALVLISIATFAIINHDRLDKKIASTVYLEVNPQIELSLNAYNKVLNAVAKNEDGEKVLGDMNLKNCHLDVALNSIIGSMFKNGYLDGNSNSILLSVQNDNSKDARKVCLDAFETISSYKDEKTNATSAAVIRVLEADDEAIMLAADNNISVAKADFIRAIRKRGVNKAFEELATLSLNDLNLIFEGVKDHEIYEYRNNEYYGDLGYYGKASDGNYIGIEKVKEIIFKDTGLNEKDIADFEADLDYEAGKMLYEVGFDVGFIEYGYVIDAVSGSIESSYKKTPNPKPITNGNSSKPSGSSDESISSKPTDSSSSKNSNSANKLDAVIAPEKALEYALVHAGVDKNNVRDPDVQIDLERYENYHYDVEFQADGYEYDYEIDAINGKVLKSHKEYDD